MTVYKFYNLRQLFSKEKWKVQKFFLAQKLMTKEAERGAKKKIGLLIDSIRNKFPRLFVTHCSMPTNRIRIPGWPWNSHNPLCKENEILMNRWIGPIVSAQADFYTKYKTFSEKDREKSLTSLIKNYQRSHCRFRRTFHIKEIGFAFAIGSFTKMLPRTRRFLSNPRPSTYPGNVSFRRN